MSQTIVKVASPGVPINVQLPATAPIQVVDLGNGTPFDLTYNGFGAPGQMIIEGGTKVRLFAKIYNPGNMTILPVNNVNVAGTGVINITVYFVSEQVPPGTYPIQIPAQIVQATVSTVSTLSNEGNAVGTEVIDIGTAANNKLIDIFNDHFTWSVEQSGAKHTVLQGKTSGNPLLIGQSGDNSEVLGNLIVDGTVNMNNSVAGKTVLVDANGNVNVGHTNPSGNNNVNANGNVRVGGFFSGFDNGGTARPIATVLAATNDNSIFTNPNNGVLHIMKSDLVTDIATFDDTGLTTALGGIMLPNTKSIQAKDTLGTAHNILQTGSDDVVTLQGLRSEIKINPPTGHATWFQVQDTLMCLADSRGFVAASGASQGYTFENGNFLPDISFFTGTGSGTYNHGYGSSPFWVSPMCTTVNSSQTQGYDTVTSTQVHITCGAGLSFKAFCG